MLGASLLLAAAEMGAAFVGSTGGEMTGAGRVARAGGRAGVRCRAPWSMVLAAGKKGAVTKALQKATGALTVSVEFAKAKDKELSELELTTLSMQLRKFKTASVWTADLELLSRIAAEQKSAKGNFPGPCPVIFNGDSSDLEAAAAAGAGGVVLGAGEQDKAESAKKLGLEVIWAIDSAQIQQAGPLVDAGLGTAFLLKSSEALDLVGALPKVRRGREL